MKKCLSCNKDFNDEEIFCPICGSKLVEENVCQKCGSPVAIDEEFCGHCGYKIEKEYRCEKCNSLINEDDSFCSNCGAKVENPVVTIVPIKNKLKNNKKVNKDNKERNPNLVNKILFLVLCGVLITCLFFAFIGCFGDIMVYRVFPSNTGAVSELDIKSNYFFGEAITAFDRDYPGNASDFRAYLVFRICLEYIFWVTALVSCVAGIAVIATKMYKNFKIKKYTFKAKWFVLPFLGLIPYLLMFTLETSGQLSATYGSDDHYFVECTYGWGTGMIITFLFIGLVTYIGYRISNAIVNKKPFILESIFYGIFLIYFSVFMASFGHTVDIDKSTSSSYFYGYTAVLRGYEAELMMNREVPEYAQYFCDGTYYLLITYLITILFFGYILLCRNKIATLIVSILFFINIFIMVGGGYMMCYIGATDNHAIANGIVNFALDDTAQLSSMGVAMAVFSVLSVVGFNVLAWLKKESKVEA